jgi:aminoglycoside N3'-acetyltransferase
MNLPEFDIGCLPHQLRNLGLGHGSTVYFASSGATLRDERQCREVLDIVLDVLGSAGTLIVPTFSFDFCDKGMFDTHRTGTYCGRISQQAIVHPLARRTWRSPVHSVAAFGALADDIVALAPDSGFGPGSVFDWMTKKDVLVCLFGVSVEDGVAHVHWLEEYHRVSYRRYQQFVGEIVCGQQHWEATTTRYMRFGQYAPSARRISEDFERLVLFGSTRNTLVRIRTFPLQQYLQFMQPRFETDRDILCGQHCFDGQ